jgi:hypothetical protein
MVIDRLIKEDISVFYDTFQDTSQTAGTSILVIGDDIGLYGDGDDGISTEVIVTAKFVVVSGLTMMLDVVDPLLQR